MRLTLRQAPGKATDDTTFNGGALSADRLDLAVMAQVAARVPLGAALAKLLAELAPTGQVSAFNASWDGPLDAPTRYQVKAGAVGLAIAAASSPEPGRVGRPGWRNAAIDFEANQTGGKAELVLNKGALLLPGVFEQSEIGFDTFSTHLAWRIRASAEAGVPAALELSLTDTRFANADAQGELSVLRWQTGAGTGVAQSVGEASSASHGHGRGARLPGRLELAGRLSRGRAAAVARYLPMGVHEAARHYVQRAVVDGRVASATFKVKGDLWDFPFASTSTNPAAPTSGEFRITARAEDVTLAYVPSQPDWVSPWPAFSRVNGELVFDRNSMEIRNASASVYGVELTRVNGGIRDLAQSVLRIEGQGRGPLADLLRYTEVTPVGEWTSHALRTATATGNAELNLKLEIPINEVARSVVQGRVTLTGNDVRLSTATPLLAGAKARVDFSQLGFSIRAGSARVLGGAAIFDGGVQPDGSQRFTAQGVVSADALRRASELGPMSRLAAHLSGQTSYRLALGIVRGHPEFTLTSPMTGLAIDLPAPLKKAAELTWPLRVESRLANAAEAEPLRDTLSVELGNVIQAQYQRDLSHDNASVLRGSIAVLDSLPPQPERGVHALLNLPAIDVDAWQALADRTQGAAPDVAKALDLGYLPRTVALRAQVFTAGGRKLTGVVAGVSQDATDATWRGSVDADQLGGYVEYRAPSGPTNPGRVHARLARLALPPADAESVEDLLVKAPASVPALDIVIDDFELRGKKFGRVEVAAANRAAEGGGREWHMSRLAVSNSDAQLTGTGQWQPGARGRSAAHGDGLQARSVRQWRGARKTGLWRYAARWQGSHEWPAFLGRLAAVTACAQP